LKKGVELRGDELECKAITGRLLQTSERSEWGKLSLTGV
jgi:hypothetical protein